MSKELETLIDAGSIFENKAVKVIKVAAKTSGVAGASGIVVGSTASSLAAQGALANLASSIASSGTFYGTIVGGSLASSVTPVGTAVAATGAVGALTTVAAYATPIGWALGGIWAGYSLYKIFNKK